MKKDEDIGGCINMVVEVLDCKMVKMKVMVFSDPWFFIQQKVKLWCM
jgi:hypothetical protein